MRKQLISTVFLVSCLLSACSSSTATDIEGAKYLARKGIIKDWNSNPEKYQFNEPITRSEVVGMALAMSGIIRNATCRGDFSDISKSEDDSACRTMETAADNGFIDAQSELPKEKRKARPNDDTLRAEALAILMHAFQEGGAWAGYSYYWDTNFPNEGDDIGYREAHLFSADWQARVFYDYIRKVLREDGKLQEKPWPTVKATRRDIFEFAANIMKSREREMSGEAPA